ncbi:MAG: hypothetical protein ACOCXJ_03105, partial [Planctomycetota bacterium]
PPRVAVLGLTPAQCALIDSILSNCGVSVATIPPKLAPAFLPQVTGLIAPASWLRECSTTLPKATVALTSDQQQLDYDQVRGTDQDRQARAAALACLARLRGDTGPMRHHRV